MQTHDYKWVRRDHRSEAEILAEIVGSPGTPMIISREDPTDLVRAMKMPQAKDSADMASDRAQTIRLFEPSSDDTSLNFSVTRDWPAPLCLIVTPPAEFGAIVIDVCRADPDRRTTAAGPHVTADSIAAWILAEQRSGTVIRRCALPELIRLDGMTAPVRRRLIPAGPRPLSESVRALLNQPGDPGAGATPDADETPDAVALRAGLFLWSDMLDESHRCSQSVEGLGRHRAGDYWHALLHRREPDYGNSKYWFRRVGRHPQFAELSVRAAPEISRAAPEWRDRILRHGWDPFAFVDFCSAAIDGSRPSWVSAAELIQEIEMLLLLQATFHDAFGRM